MGLSHCSLTKTLGVRNWSHFMGGYTEASWISKLPKVTPGQV